MSRGVLSLQSRTATGSGAAADDKDGDSIPVAAIAMNLIQIGCSPLYQPAQQMTFTYGCAPADFFLTVIQMHMKTLIFWAVAFYTVSFFLFSAVWYIIWKCALII